MCNRSHNNNNGRSRSTIIGIGDGKLDTIPHRYSSTKISNYNNNSSPTTPKHYSRIDSYHSTHSYYNVDIKSKKSEWIKNGVSTIPNNNDNNYNQRFSTLSLPDNNNNTKLHHSYNGSTSNNNVKLIKKSYRNTTSIVNNYY